MHVHRRSAEEDEEELATVCIVDLLRKIRRGFSQSRCRQLSRSFAQFPIERLMRLWLISPKPNSLCRCAHLCTHQTHFSSLRMGDTKTIDYKRPPASERSRKTDAKNSVFVANAHWRHGPMLIISMREALARFPSATKLIFKYNLFINKFSCVKRICFFFRCFCCCCFFSLLMVVV